MAKVNVFLYMTLDGVIQAPGRADEDRRGGFAHGGWAQPYNDPVIGEVVGAGLADAGPLLFGRRTYEDFAGFWPKQTDNPFTPVLNAARKYVVSRTLTEPLPWRNSTLLTGDVAAAVANLKEHPGKDLTILGSGELLRTLMRHNLIDEYQLLICPRVLGSGRRLFPDDGTVANLRLVNAVPTPSGVVIATYQPAPVPAAPAA